MGSSDRGHAGRRADLPTGPARGDSELTVLNEANVAKALGRPNGEVQDTVRVLIDWAIEHQRDWFYKFER